MTAPDTLTLSDLRQDKVRRALAGGMSSEILWLLLGNRPQPGGVSTVRLVVTDHQPEQLGHLLAQQALPRHTPILILGSSPGPPCSMPQGQEDRLIDYLALPTATSLFCHRLFLLSRMEQISAENASCASTMQHQLNALYSRDSLTGLLNRHQLTQRLPEAFQQAGEQEDDLAILLLNIDYFNNINKSLGLSFGDHILNEMAARLTQALPGKGSCYRFSSEDFIILMPESDLEGALASARHLSEVCTDKPFANGHLSKRITVSVGIATLRAHLPKNYEQFLAMAESALFAAKAEGRNRICVYQPLTGTDDSSGKGQVFLKQNLHRIFEKTRCSTISSLELLARSVAGSEYQAHLDSVSRYTNLLGEHLGLPEHHLQTFQNAIALYSSLRFLLHNDLIIKPGQLTAAEKQTIGELPFKLSELTDMFHYFAEEKRVLESHTERYDGSGFPYGLRADEIPLGARIFAVVNALAAMTSQRPYRRSLAPAEILQELKNQAGHQFDPMLVLHTLEIIEKKQILEVSPLLIARIRRDLLDTFPELSP